MKSKKKQDSLLHNATRRMLFCFRIVGIFPLDGLRQQNIGKLRFNYASFIFFILCLCLKMLELISDIYLIIVSKFAQKAAVDSFLDIFKILRMTRMVRLAYEWPAFLEATSNIEGCLQTDKKKVLKKCTTLHIVFNALNVLNDSFFLWFIFQLSLVCSKLYSSPFKTFIKFASPVSFDFTTYATWKAVILLISFCQNIYVKDSFDILLMQLSIYLTGYFEDFNRRVKESAQLINGKTIAWVLKEPSQVKPVDWASMRIEYTTMSRLVTMVNEKISALIFMSFGNDLILLWGQFMMLFRRGQFIDYSQCDLNEFRSIWSMYNYSRTVFLYSGTICLIYRFFLTAFLAAKLHSTAKKSALTLYEISERMEYNIEVDRLVTQIQTSTIAFSGMGFFHVTKSMILSLAGTIVTYELMALQFATNFSSDPTMIIEAMIHNSTSFNSTEFY